MQAVPRCGPSSTADVYIPEKRRSHPDIAPVICRGFPVPQWASSSFHALDFEIEIIANERVALLSFCGKAQTEVKTLVAGPGVFICDECVQLCQAIIAKKKATQEMPGSLLPANAPTETLLKTLAGYNGAFERVDVSMQDVVDILREREVSWAIIGQALAVPRQAAWKRFG